MSWIHCNKCGIQKASLSTTEFYCSSCSHVLCKDCSRQKICPIDNHPFNGIKLSRTMPPKLRSYFEDPNKFLSLWQKCIQFQFEQRTIWESHQFPSNIKKTRQLKNEIKLLKKTKDILQQNVEKDAKRIQKMKAYLKYSSFTPNSNSTSVTSLNVSSTLHEESGVDMQFDETD